MKTRSKKAKTVDNTPHTLEEKNNFDELPHDLVIEILGRLPVKSLVRFLTVSKLWETTIRSREFVTSFPFNSSSLQPRILIAHGSLFSAKLGENQNLKFFSASSSSSTSVLSRVTCPVPYPRRIEFFYHHVNGLISIGYGQEQIITNPSTGQIITLPRCKTRRRVVKSFFGYDSVDDEYKILCMTEKLHGRVEEASSQHQVLTVGAKKESWRMIDCSTPHRPWSNGVCIDGVVYYIAKTGSEMLQLSIMRFDLRSEVLDRFTTLPALIPYQSLNYESLITYQGKLAIPISRSGFIYDVWVIDQAAEKHEWLKKITFSTEEYLKGKYCYLRVRGTTRTGDVILAPPSYPNEFYVVHYNPGTKRFRKIMFQITNFKPYPYVHFRAIVLSDNYVESIRLFKRDKS